MTWQQTSNLPSIHTISNECGAFFLQHIYFPRFQSIMHKSGLFFKNTLKNHYIRLVWILNKYVFFLDMHTNAENKIMKTSWNYFSALLQPNISIVGIRDYILLSNTDSYHFGVSQWVELSCYNPISKQRTMIKMQQCWCW